MTRVIAGLAALLSALCLATGALAHASLVSAEPSDGSLLTQSPKTVQLRFNEAVTPAVIGLIDAAGKSRDDFSFGAVDQSIVITLPDNLPRGTQVVSYRVVSQDGHPIAGSLVFSIGVVTGAATAENAGPAPSLIWLARIAVYIGLFAGVGGAFFAAWIGQARTGSNVVRGALLAGLVGAVVSLGLQGLELLNLHLGSIVTASPWKTALETSLGSAVLIAIAAVIAGLFALRCQSAAVARALSALAMAGVGISLAVSGHAATASPQWLTRPVVFIHGVGIAYWVGALAPLVAMAWRPTPALMTVLNRFSRVAVPVVGLLVLTGFTLSVVQLQSWDAIIETKYGFILSIKLILVAVLLGLAGLNRFRLTPAIAADPPNTRPLVRSILAECVVVVGILAVVAGWRFTPPPRALTASMQAPLAIHIHTERAMFQVLISPGTVGSDDFVLQLMAGDASPLPAREATLTLSLPERGIEALERNASLGPDGYWHVRGVPLPLPGRWHMQIDVLVTDFEKITLEDDFEVR